ncbi:transketolase-like TK C-terminal-containing protein [Microbacterium arabinogalactanolyticum]|uniref:transketolase-like TK C-terminal-containing protein n=1 Tax=Microbacterium arabinogalactanolyticum TaxID=69365 RepID=UPI00255523CB|nr:pyruvate dehydrogenase [Microbacterium arabinogalactanolyticum]GLC86054.1 pyruvate dehydrogenase E1 component [Microbacterium arabinogalactanolyticum]
MNAFAAPVADSAADLRTLAAIEQRVLWLSTSMIHHANRVRPNPSGLKVGGHQASSASIATIMTALWFDQLQPEDRVSVKPHASPVLHGIHYLLGELDDHHMGSLREFGGIQSYPSRSKDPDTVDYSTGSVGIGATAPIWGAIARRYAATISGASAQGRQYSLVGDAELDEGAVWEAVLDPHVSDLGEIVWIVDLNRQSLDRVVPNIAAGRLERMFSAAGWQVITVPFGQRLEALLSHPGGAELRRRILDMPNAEYQRLLRCPAAELRHRLPGAEASASAIRALLETVDDDELVATIRNLGGHDLATLREAFAQIDDARPTVIIAYTIKGNGLPTAGHPQNHSSLLTHEQYAQLAQEVGMDPSAPWQRFEPDSPEGRACAATARRLTRDPVPAAVIPAVPADFGRTPSGSGTTQAALGRVLLDLTRSAPEVARRVVTASPDVSTSTNLAGWLNKVGVWSTDDRQDWFEDDPETIMHWRERLSGQHIELGIAEVNLVSLIGELGATWSRWGQPLYPIGVLYDPFVERALEPWSYGMYAGGQSILIGTPSGVSLAAEGGAHQSIKTPSIGIEQPDLLSYEPAFVQEVEWSLLAAMSQMARPGGRSAYLRLSTKPVDQGLAAIPADPAARERRRRQVVAGAYRLRTADAPVATLVAMGVMVPDALRAADRLAALGRQVDVIVVTSPGLLFDAVQARGGQGSADTWILDQVLPAERAVPMVTVLDGHPHALAFLAGIQGVPARHLGVSRFGQAGDLADVYRYHGIDEDSMVRAVLDLAE